MKIRMLTNAISSEDGFTVHDYKKGCIYDLRDSQCERLIRAGRAVLAEAPKSIEETIARINHAAGYLNTV